MHRNCGFLITVLALFTTAILSNPVPDPAATTSHDSFADLKTVYRIYKDCSDKDLSVCLKIKLLTALDRVGRVYKRVPILNDWIEIVKIEDNGISNGESAASVIKESDLEANLPRSINDRESTLNQMLIEKVISFFQTHSFQLKLPSFENMKRSLTEEGRLKKKKFGNLLMLPLMIGGTLVPLVLGGIAILAFKALFVAKIALVLALLVGMKKMLGGGLNAEKSEYVVNSAPPSWSRSLNAQQLAYSAHIPTDDKVN